MFINIYHLPIQISELVNIQTPRKGGLVNKIYSIQGISIIYSRCLVRLPVAPAICDSFGKFQDQRWPMPIKGLIFLPCENCHVTSAEIFHGMTMLRRGLRVSGRVITAT